MSYVDAAILGILQGLTEFFPISSSGHLVLVQSLLGVKVAGVSFELLVHLGSLAAVLIYFRERIVELVRAVFDRTMVPQRKVIAFLVIGTIPAGVVGVLLDDFFEQAFSNPTMTSYMLLATGLILLSTRFVRPREGEVTLVGSIVMGLGQALAIFPGISRSGSTIAAGMLCGIKPTEAAEFSFLLAVPAIGGAVVLKAGNLAEIGSELMGPYLAGMVLSFIFSLAAVHLLLKIVRRGRFQYFAYYCFAAGLVGLYLFS